RNVGGVGAGGRTVPGRSPERFRARRGPIRGVVARRAGAIARAGARSSGEAPGAPAQSGRDRARDRDGAQAPDARSTARARTPGADAAVRRGRPARDSATTVPAVRRRAAARARRRARSGDEGPLPGNSPSALAPVCPRSTRRTTGAVCRRARSSDSWRRDEADRARSGNGAVGRRARPGGRGRRARRRRARRSRDRQEPAHRRARRRCHTSWHDDTDRPLVRIGADLAVRSMGRRGRIAEDAELLTRLGPTLRPELARLLPEIGGAPAPGAGAAAHPLIFESVTHLLGHLAARQPWLVVLEDLHWADEMSARLLAFAGRRLVDRPAMVVLTAREEEMVDAPALRRVMEDLEREGRMTTLALGPLSRADTVALGRAFARSDDEASP